MGITWDNARGTVEVVDRRCAKILDTIDSIVDSGFVILPEMWPLSRGKLFLHYQFLGTSPESVMTRHCAFSTLSDQHWEEKIELDQYCI